MSHTTSTETTNIKNPAMLKAAVKELAKLGVKCELQTGGVPRMYYDNQFINSDLAKKHGLTECDFVLKLNGSHDENYDVGIFKVKGEDGYRLVADYHAAIIRNQIGTSQPKGTLSAERFNCGKLLREYQTQEALQAARRKFTKVTLTRTAAGEAQIRILA